MLLYCARCRQADGRTCFSAEALNLFVSIQRLVSYRQRALGDTSGPLGTVTSHSFFAVVHIARKAILQFILSRSTACHVAYSKNADYEIICGSSCGCAEVTLRLWCEVLSEGESLNVDEPGRRGHWAD